MKVTPVTPKPVPGTAQAPRRTPRVAAARRIDDDRPRRMWSLLLPPRLEGK